MQYELILVFEHAHRNPQLDRNTRLALDIPTSMTLEEREHLFVVWNRLAEQYTAFLSGLPAGVRQCIDARARPISSFRAQCLIEIRPATLLAVLPAPDLAQMQLRCWRHARQSVPGRRHHRIASHSKLKSVG